jgi:hypothetical protein
LIEQRCITLDKAETIPRGFPIINPNRVEQTLFLRQNTEGSLSKEKEINLTSAETHGVGG